MRGERYNRLRHPTYVNIICILQLRAISNAILFPASFENIFFKNIMHTTTSLVLEKSMFVKRPKTQAEIVIYISEWAFKH